MRNFKINKNFFSVSFISLLYPFLGFLISLFYFDKKWFPKIIFFGCIFFGFVYQVPNSGVDSYFYKKDFLLYGTYDYSQFIGYIMTVESQKSDIIEPFIAFFISRFTSEPQYLFLTYSIIFGYFLYSNLNILYKNSIINRNIFSFFLVIGFILLNGIWNINGFRFWLACHMFIFSILKLFIEKKKLEAIIVLILLPFIHFSFILPIAIYILFLVINKYLNNKILTIICLLASFINVINVNGIILSKFEGILPEFLFIKVDSYTNVEYANKLVSEKDDLSIFSIIHNFLIKIYLFLFFVINFKNISQTKYIYFYKFFLFFTCFALVLQAIPSMGRFLTICYLLSVSYMILNNYSKTTNMKYLSIFIFLFSVGLLRIYGFFFDDRFFISNFFIELIR